MPRIQYYISLEIINQVSHSLSVKSSPDFRNEETKVY